VKQFVEVLHHSTSEILLTPIPNQNQFMISSKLPHDWLLEERDQKHQNFIMASDDGVSPPSLLSSSCLCLPKKEQLSNFLALWQVFHLQSDHMFYGMPQDQMIKPSRFGQEQGLSLEQVVEYKIDSNKEKYLCHKIKLTTRN
jgi:hypothetical protein